LGIYKYMTKKWCVGKLKVSVLVSKSRKNCPTRRWDNFVRVKQGSPACKDRSVSTDLGPCHLARLESPVWWGWNKHSQASASPPQGAPRMVVCTF
jgi:hypothetical protein